MLHGILRYSLPISNDSRIKRMNWIPRLFAPMSEFVDHKPDIHKIETMDDGHSKHKLYYLLHSDVCFSTPNLSVTESRSCNRYAFTKYSEVATGDHG